MDIGLKTNSTTPKFNLMGIQFNENKLIEIFIEVDDFCNALDNWLVQQGKVKPSKYKGQLSKSEILTILIFYHHSGYKCFQYYYNRMVRSNLRDYFPKIISYKRFLSYIPKCTQHLFLLGLVQCSKSHRTGIYFIDSKKLPVCHNKRIHSNQVFKDVARRGKSSTGWFYGLKLHLIINNLGEIIAFRIAPANISDNNKELLSQMLEGLQGHCYGDKGYLSKLFEHFYEQGLKLVTKIRSNMKNKLMDMSERMWLCKRAIIESVNDILMTVCDIEHTRHRSPVNAVCHMFGAIIAYNFLDHKPMVCLTKCIG